MGLNRRKGGLAVAAGILGGIVFGIFASAAAAETEAEKKRELLAELRKNRGRIIRTGVPTPVPNTNDLCSTPYTISVGEYSGNTVFSTNDGSSTCMGTNDVWFLFTAPQAGSYLFDTLAASFDTVISLHSACPGTTANQIACADFIGGDQLTRDLALGQTVRVRLAGYEGEEGNYILKVEQTGLANENLSLAVDDTGNFTLARAGDPDDVTTHLLYGHPNPGTSATTLSVNGLTDWNYGFGGGGTIGTQVSGPDLIGDAVVTVYSFQQVQLTERLRLVEGPTPGVIDNLLIEYTMLNQGAAAKQVGVRVFLDTWLGSTDGAGFLVPGLGVVTTEREKFGIDIPQFWTSYDSFGAGGKRAQGTLSGLGEAVRPDRVVWGDWPSMTASQWNYAINPNRSVLSDSAVLIYWNPATLGPGQSRTVATYYGLSALNSDLNPPLAANVTAPTVLEVFSNEYLPNPFPVSAYIENSLAGVTTPANGAYAQITLPEGLTLVGGAARAELGNLNVGFGAFANWTVEADALVQLRAAPTALTGVEYEFQIEIGATGKGSKTIMRQLTVPYLQNGAAGWQLYE